MVLMNSTRGVDVVVPSYNHAPYVERTLRSIFRQSVPPTNLLVIDDGSHDDSPTVIARALEEAPFPAELVVQQNAGLCTTLNRGLTAGTSPYFAYIGSDDMWHPDFLRDRIEALEQRPAAVLAYGHAVLVDSADRRITSTRLWSNYVDGDVQPMLLRGEAPSSASVLYRRRVVEDVGSWLVGSRLEDYDLYLRLSSRGPWLLDPTERSAWRRHGSNTSLDVAMMLDETLSAQRRHADVLRLDPRQLASAEAAARFRAGYSHLLAGDRGPAARESLRGWAGAPTAAARSRRAALIACPDVARRWARRASTRRKGSVATGEPISWGSPTS